MEALKSYSIDLFPEPQGIQSYIRNIALPLKTQNEQDIDVFSYKYIRDMQMANIGHCPNSNKYLNSSKFRLWGEHRAPTGCFNSQIQSLTCHTNPLDNTLDMQHLHT